MQEKINVLCIAGPTASGKTSLAVEVALLANGEVVSADSMQIYKGMNIGTAKPTSAEMRGVPHHMIDIIDIGEPFSVATYVKKATDAISDIASRGKLPIIAGGTGLYINCLLGDMSFGSTKPDYEYREKLTRLAQESGKEALYAMLMEKDPETASKLHSNDAKRVMRALEILNSTQNTKGEMNKGDREEGTFFNPAMFCLMPSERSILYKRIDKRVDEMVEQGLLEEAKALMPKFKNTSAQAIGYKELMPYFDGQCELSDAIENIKRETRRYAKRQITWFKRDKRMNFIFFDKVKIEAQKIIALSEEIWTKKCGEVTK